MKTCGTIGHPIQRPEPSMKPFLAVIAAAAHFALQHDQLLSECSFLSLKLAPRFEERGNQVQGEA